METADASSASAAVAGGDAAEIVRRTSRPCRSASQQGHGGDAVSEVGKKRGKRCAHGKSIWMCRDCPEGGASICVHRRLRRYCRQCTPSAYCKHGRRKGRCGGRCARQQSRSRAEVHHLRCRTQYWRPPMPPMLALLVIAHCSVVRERMYACLCHRARGSCFI